MGNTQKVEFWVYLWGIETKPDLVTLLLALPFWVYLWGIETFKTNCASSSKCPFWVYLWGIETWFQASTLRKLTVFWVYLWGIETWTRIDFARRSLRFESTYEELKQIGVSVLCIIGLSFESTYEELKRVTTGYVVYGARLCFESTYEELKLLFDQATYEAKPVLSLPMRNWNNEASPLAELFQLVLSLPMRNWNPTGTVRALLSIIVLSLPMRNWNLYFLLDISEYMYVLSLPMRNWNCSSNPGTCICSRFWVYLWGIETRLPMLVPGNKIEFWVYLWGIETFPLQVGHNYMGVCFESTYEELKQNSDKFLLLFLHRFESTYEELKLENPSVPMRYIQAVLSLPMRNWNLNKRVYSRSHKLRFESTYEELKH